MPVAINCHHLATQTPPGEKRKEKKLYKNKQSYPSAKNTEEFSSKKSGEQTISGKKTRHKEQQDCAEEHERRKKGGMK